MLRRRWTDSSSMKLSEESWFELPGRPLDQTEPTARVDHSVIRTEPADAFTLSGAGRSSHKQKFVRGLSFGLPPPASLGFRQTNVKVFN